MKKPTDFESCAVSILFILIFLWGIGPAIVASYMLFEDTFYKLKLAIHYKELMEYDLEIYKGKLVKTDVYVYKVKARDIFGEWHDFTGKVSVIK